MKRKMNLTTEETIFACIFLLERFFLYKEDFEKIFLG